MTDIRVSHVITGLDTGGAEMMLVKLLTQTRNTLDSRVIALSSRSGSIAERIERLGVPLERLDIRSFTHLPRGIIKFASLLVRHPADVVQSWMYHANLLTSATTLLLPERPVVWNVRASLPRKGQEKAGTARVIGAGRLLGWHPRKIVYNSQAAALQHATIGYPRGKSVVIPNGFDTEEFKPDPEARSSTRRELGVDDAHFLIGHVGRFHPMKDHATFLRAFGELSRTNGLARAVMVGAEVSEDNSELTKMIADGGFGTTVRLMGERSDIARIMPALDLFVSSSSRQEGFSNVLGEAMACGVPCVATDVGDASLIVAGSGSVVPVGDAGALAAAMSRVLDLDVESRGDLARRARDSIIARYSMSAIAASYVELYSAMRQ